MNNVHLIMQGKGGVGKSVVAVNIAQFLKLKDPATLVIDTDPLTPTLSRYKALDPVHIQIADQAEVHLGKFDEMIEMIINTKSSVVIDTGASTFLPISKYLTNDAIFELLHDEYQKEIFVHVVLNAQTQNDLLSTVACLESIATSFPEIVKLVIWLNEFGGPIKGFEESKLYHSIKHRVMAIIEIKNPDELSLKDIGTMQNSFLTYEEAILSGIFWVVSKSRLFRLRKFIFDQLENLLTERANATPAAAEVGVVP